jgi:hypothetical protein
MATDGAAIASVKAAAEVIAVAAAKWPTAAVMHAAAVFDPVAAVRRMAVHKHLMRVKLDRVQRIQTNLMQAHLMPHPMRQ